MTLKNPFDGKGVYTKFVWAIYKRMMGREWFTYGDVMADRLGLKSAEDLPCGVAKCDNYGELKKAFSDLRRLINDKTGENCIEERGNNRAKQFRYVGVDANPLEDLQNSSAIKDIRTYAQFCEDSAGFFPRSWLDYFFEDTLDLLKITRRRKDGEQMISSSIDRELTNLHLLPMLYEAIRDRKILNVEYKPYDVEPVGLVFHPHLLKEYNGRWFLFGHAEGMMPEFGYNLPLDRIVGTPQIIQPAKNFVVAPKGFYTDFFKDKVGVSHEKGAVATEITIRATSLYIFMLTDTKIIHPSQVTTKPFSNYDDGEYGEFKLYVEPNKEFIGRILQMGDGLVVVSPDNVRDLLRQSVFKMVDLYK